ncbi:hypothetical protein HYH03_008814 [Edaphochlamys debaryana]|uniref:Protein kinase domain-containing protein n=1 Tax=Edaphochlamys debaryana TaxID=47281 RepID=A0A835XZJ2_9CHLO|nr:hypothetical protein HYH03_008814 [Edaphochlamys debaryana]|eukprot:KAG2492900.1 hypothetical protein HYH03_008814 [Edaphochlamys debaryana]
MKPGGCGYQPHTSVGGPFTYRTTRLPDPVITVDQGINITAYSSMVPADSSLASQGLFFGGYQLVILRTLYYAEHVVDPDCLKQRQGDACVTLLREQLRAQNQSSAVTPASAGAARHMHASKAALVGTAVAAFVLVVLAVTVAAVLVLHYRRKRLEQAAAAGGSNKGSHGDASHATSASSRDLEAGMRQDGDKPSPAEAEAAPKSTASSEVLEDVGCAATGPCTGGTCAPSLSARRPDGPPLDPVMTQAGPAHQLKCHASLGDAKSTPTAPVTTAVDDPPTSDTRVLIITSLSTSSGSPPTGIAYIAPEAEGDDQDPSASAFTGQSSDVYEELSQLSSELRASVGDVAIELQRVIGSGTFGTVYKGTWQGLPVAVKTVLFSANAENRRRALQEAALCKSINHPNVIATYASDLQSIGDDSTPVQGDTPRAGVVIKSTSTVVLAWRLFIVQEFADGGPLRGLYGNRAIWPRPGVAVLPAVVSIVLGIARALAHLHSKRIVHGDLNPNNVLLKRDRREASGFAVKVGDFGLSVLLPEHCTHLSNMRQGTMFYICPSVAVMGRVGPEADVFSLGVMMWELYYGVCAGLWTEAGPCYCPEFPNFPPSCPAAFRNTALGCLQRRPQFRPTAAVVEEVLSILLQDLGPPTGMPVVL